MVPMKVSDPVESLTVEAAVERESEILSKIEFQLLLDPPSRVQMIAIPKFRDFGNDMGKDRHKGESESQLIGNIPDNDEDVDYCRGATTSEREMFVSVVTKCKEAPPSVTETRNTQSGPEIRESALANIHNEEEANANKDSSRHEKIALDGFRGKEAESTCKLACDGLSVEIIRNRHLQFIDINPFPMSRGACE